MKKVSLFLIMVLVICFLSSCGNSNETESSSDFSNVEYTLMELQWPIESVNFYNFDILGNNIGNSYNGKYFISTRQGEFILEPRDYGMILAEPTESGNVLLEKNGDYAVVSSDGTELLTISGDKDREDVRVEFFDDKYVGFTHFNDAGNMRGEDYITVVYNYNGDTVFSYEDEYSKLSLFPTIGQDKIVGMVNDSIFVFDIETGSNVYTREGTISGFVEDIYYQDDLLVLPTNYSMVGPPEKWGAIDLEGNDTVDYIYESLSNFSNGFAFTFYSDDDGYGQGLIDKSNNTIIPNEYKFLLLNGNTSYGDNFNYASIDSNIVIARNNNNLWGAFDLLGEEIIPFEYDYLGTPNEGLIPFMLYGQWGYLDYDGNIVIEPQYNDAQTFSQGYGCVLKDGNILFINNNNESIFEPIVFVGENIDGSYTQAPSFEQEGIFDKNGLTLLNGEIITINGDFLTGEIISRVQKYENGLIYFEDETILQIYINDTPLV